MAQRSNDDDCFLADIPWIKRPIGDKRMEETKFYKGIGSNCPLDEKSKRLQLFWFINETFPFYLPQRYHAMDCLALHKNSKDGNYWANASVFLFNTTAYGHRFLADVDAFLEIGKPDMQNLSQSTSLYKTVKLKYLKDTLEECESGAEFLLDPWVLLQLPFQPMLIYQWSVALRAEAFKFEKKIHEIVYSTSQTNLKVLVDKLMDMHFKMAKFADYHLNVFFIYTKLRNGCNYHKFVHGSNGNIKDFLVSRFPEVLPIIEFVLSPKFSKVINSLKRLAIGRRNVHQEKSFFEIKQCSVTLFSSYNLFWNRKDELVSLYIEDESNLAQHDKNINISKGPVEQFNQESIFADYGELEEAAREKYGDQLLKLPYARQSITLKALLDEHAGKQKVGIIHNVVTLQLKAASKELYNMWIDFVIRNYEDLKDKLLNILNDDIDYQEAQYNFRKVSEILSKVQSDQKWSYQNILKKVKDSFDEKLMEFPDFDQGAEKIALHLQERIRRIVLMMIERQYKSFNEENFLHYPECQFVQLILPCFVASFLDLDKDPLASEETKRKYFDFLHELFKSYETVEFSYRIFNPVNTKPFACAVNSNFGDCYLSHRFEHVEKVMRKMLSNSKIYDDFMLKGISSNILALTFVKSKKAKCSLNVCNWQHLLFMFNSRMRSVFRKIGFPIDPLLRKIEIERFTFPYDLKKICKEHNLVLKTQKCKKIFPKDPEGLKQKLLKLGVPSNMIQDAQAITEPNIDGLLLYLMLKYFSKGGVIRNSYNKFIDPPGFPLDPLVSAYWFLGSNDSWKLKLQLANMFTMRKENEDPSLISFEVAGSNIYYHTILKSILPDGKVQMSRPGEITFFPVKHCRWCGQVKVEEFRVCPVCAETPDYPDLNLFCSEICEREALEKQHEEEHINFLMELCGIDS